MSIKLCTDNDVSDICPICGNEMEDRRHVSVECFYDVKEYVPDATEQTMFVEVPEEGSYWGITRHYPEGTRDEHFVSGKKTSKNGLDVICVDVKQKKIPSTRLLEKSVYTVDCCKDCRADFLKMFGVWASGGLSHINKDHQNVMVSEPHIVSHDDTNENQ